MDYCYLLQSRNKKSVGGQQQISGVKIYGTELNINESFSVPLMAQRFEPLWKQAQKKNFFWNTEAGRRREGGSLAGSLRTICPFNFGRIQAAVTEKSWWRFDFHWILHEASTWEILLGVGDRISTQRTMF